MKQDFYYKETFDINKVGFTNGGIPPFKMEYETEQIHILINIKITYT